MPMIPHHPSSSARNEDGFTLIETLVAMISGVVVTGATFMIFIVALHQTSRITDSVQATQLGRTTMTRVIDELHSACIARKFAPVQAESSKNKLIFINAYSKEAVIPKTEAYKHEIEWSGETTQKLTDTATPASSGEWPNFTFASTPTKTVLGEHIAEGKTPIFKYYEYGETYSSSSSEPVSTLIEMKNIPSNGMSTTEAGKVAAVLVGFTAKPIDGETALSRSAEFSNQVTFAFGAPSSETKIVDGPCQ